MRESYEEGLSSLSSATRDWANFAAGTPPDLAAPSDEDRLMMLTLEAGAGQKRAAVWHIHVLKVSETTVNAHSQWQVTAP